ncbi:MAG: hypothetical protein HYI21_06890 [Sediminibacterium sp. Gen4]|jgi:hypothetical protein|uniref:hypothetical protein n=1 Tax=unclassified Sediminibacterium TaxID=2635961 RepID=UPI0015C0B36E|nr:MULTISPECIES: hypothetical protein [unclassified Sediminibacterium]MBW0164929.1 hypothetical protein [Sediminibacterium sp.]NWK65735.1 hypothetical protein [Sediminibacterium sp. Gen4]
MRDDFKQEIKETLAKRVAFVCSNPECNMSTIGPNSEQGKSTNIGVAAHITAASKGGKRYDETLSAEQRSSIDNGIWLCQTCSKLIDTDEKKYTIELLKKWRDINEKKAATRLNKQIDQNSAMFADKGDFEKIKENGYYEKEFSGQKVRYYLQGPFLHIEHELRSGIIVYYVIDELGNLVDTKFPFPLHEYSIKIDDGLILNSKKEILDQNYSKETILMKWGKVAIITKDPDGKMVNFHIEKGATIDHINKVILVTAPTFEKK